MTVPSPPFPQQIWGKGSSWIVTTNSKSKKKINFERKLKIA